MKDLGTFLLFCVRCNQEYMVNTEELQSKVTEQTRSRRSMSEFYAFHD